MDNEVRFNDLVSNGYFILSWAGKYCCATRVVGGVEKYVLLVWNGDRWVVRL